MNRRPLIAAALIALSSCAAVGPQVSDYCPHVTDMTMSFCNAYQAGVSKQTALNVVAANTNSPVEARQFGLRIGNRTYDGLQSGKLSCDSLISQNIVAEGCVAQ